MEILSRRERWEARHIQEIESGVVQFKRLCKKFFALYRKNTNPHHPNFGKLEFQQNMFRKDMLKYLRIKKLTVA